MAINIPYRTGGEHTVTATSIISISSGVTGTIGSISAVAGQRIVLTHFSAVSADQVGISIQSNSVDVLATSIILEAIESGSPSSGSFAIAGRTQPMAPIISDIGQDLTFIKNAGNTSQALIYSYQYVKST